MVWASTVDVALNYLKNVQNYGIWTTALGTLRDRVEASSLDRVLFAASDDQACILAGFPSGEAWAAQDPNAFLAQIVALPPCWPSAPVGLYASDTLAVDEVTSNVLFLHMRVSPESFVLPSLQGSVACERPVPLRDAMGSALLLRSSFLTLSWSPPPARTLQDVLHGLSPELGLFSRWLLTCGLGQLAASPGAWTLLAPTNAAFEALARTLGLTGAAFVATPAYARMAQYHVVAGVYAPTSEGGPPASVVASDGFLLSFQGRSASEKGNGGVAFRYVNTARVDEDLSQAVDNGVVWVLDAVLSHGASGP